MRLLYISLSTNIRKLLLTIRPYHISNRNSRSSHIKKLMYHWRIRSFFFFTPEFLLVSIALTVTNTLPACLFDFHGGRTNPGTVGAALTSYCFAHSGSSMALLCSISDSLSATHSSALTFGLSKSPFQCGQLSVSEMLSGTFSSSLSTGWWLIPQIRRTFMICVHPPGRFFAHKAGSKGDLLNNLNAAAPWCWMSDQKALTISSVTKMYPTAVICLSWARDSFCVARRFWLPCQFSKKLWTLAILCNVLSSTSFCISGSFSVLVVTNTVLSPAKMPLLARPNCLTTTISRRVPPVVIDCL